MIAIQNASRKELLRRAREREILRDAALSIGDERTAEAAERMRKLYLGRINQIEKAEAEQ